jgi:PqqD family protein of HPr-rel-A system
MTGSDAKPSRTGTHLEKDLSGEYLFYDHRGERVHVLNGTAREIYLLCDGALTAREIAAALREQFDVDEETALRDVGEALGRLRDAGLVTLE